MAEIAVPIALFLIDKGLSSLSHVPLKKNLRDEVTKEVKNCLERMESHLRDKESSGKEGSELHKNKVKQVRQIAHDTEDVLDKFLLHATLRFHSHKITRKADEFAHAPIVWCHLQVMFSEMNHIKTKIKELTALDRFCNNETISGQGGSTSSTSTSGPWAEHHHHDSDYDYEIVVGFEKYTGDLISQLKGAEPRGLKTISLVGPCGSGKSTIAMNVYGMARGEGLFDCYAWVHASRSLKIKEILSSMLKQFRASIGEEEPTLPHQSADQPVDSNSIRAKLRNYLREKRYVVFLDDIWSKRDWENIKVALPDGSTGSRIVVTTRNLALASFFSEESHIHELRDLSWADAWQLFCNKAFQANECQCPPELVNWSQNIVKRCDGNPLAIVAVGTLLSKKKQLPKEWQRMHDNLVSEIGTDSNLSIINKLLVSYKDLPRHLRICFLYFSIFPEDYTVKRGRLVRLWIAEGFVDETGGRGGHKTLEDVAEDYLNELVERNLVQAITKDFDGRVKGCRVLNFVLDFIILKAGEENFVSILQEEQDTTIGSSEKARRLSIQNVRFTLTRRRKDLGLSSVRSTFFYKTGELSPLVIGDILGSLELVKVLDLRHAPLEKFPEEILHFTLLRYLSLRNTKVANVPKSIKKLPYLETLDLKQTFVAELPEQINQLHNLRHLLVYRDNDNFARFNPVRGVKIAEGIGALTNLQKLLHVELDKNHKIIKELGEFTQLRKLGLTKLRREHGKDLCTSIQKMKNLSTIDVSSTGKDECLDLNNMSSPPPHLQRLYLKGRLQELPGWISSLNNLFRIDLQWSKLKSSPLQALQQLPNLIELQMVDAFTGVELVFEAGSFKKLKILKIEQLDLLHKMVVEEGTMPVLQKMSLCHCMNLNMPPLGINKYNLTQLEELLLYGMPREFIDRLQKKQIREDREMVSRIPVIHSFVLGANGSWSLHQNLS